MNRPRTRTIFVFAAALIGAGISPARASSAPCLDAAASCRGELTLAPQGKIELYRSFDLNTPNAAVTQAVIIVHGLGRNFGGSFSKMIQVYSDPAQAARTLVIAPHFFADVDRPAASYAFWSVNGWAAGADSLDASHLSSYEVLDQLLTQVAGSSNFPNLRRIIVTGLSAGGQTTQRYAAGNDVERRFPAVHFRYIVASPSSYLYLDENRWVRGTHYEFAVPADAGCAFDQYRYGLEGLNRYMSLKDPARIVSDYLSRDLSYLVGDQDDATAAPSPPIPHDPKDGADLDVSCAAELEGSSRYERALVFGAYLGRFYPWNAHGFAVARGVAHQLAVYDAPEAQEWLLR